MSYEGHGKKHDDNRGKHKDDDNIRGGLRKIDDNGFYVIAVCSNPVRYHARYNLYKKFSKHIRDLGAKLLTVEIAYGRREFELTQRDDVLDLQFRTNEEIWHKENAINLAIQYLCQLDPNWQYVAWIDGDIHFQRDDIIQETIHQLQHYDVVQMFSHVTDLGPQMEPLKTHNGFMWSYVQNNNEPPIGPGYGGYYGAHKNAFWHPGYAWAARREALDKITLFDKAILGSADHHMALGLIGAAHRSLPQGVSKGYRDAVMQWGDNADLRLRRNVGYVPGMITHYWHGNKKDRRYVERWDVLTKLDFDPHVDISRDQQGLYRLNYNHGKRSIKLRDQIRKYFRQRNEDSIDLF